jgi:hypothetical protein
LAGRKRAAGATDPVLTRSLRMGASRTYASKYGGVLTALS